MKLGKAGEIYNLGSGVGYSIQTILDWLTAAANVPISVVVDQAKFRPLDIESVIADNSKMRQLGWQPSADLHDTVVRILAWWRTQK